MSKKNNLIGQRFGRLVVQSLSSKKYRRELCWDCLCDCGKVVCVRGCALKSGNTQSCGCLKGERLRAATVKHGMRNSPEYTTWRGMIERCKNKNHSNAKYYNKRGITVCNRWQSFENFFKDMGRRPSGKTIERINNDKGYSPDNCRWATMQEQRANQTPRKNVVRKGRGYCWHKATNKWQATFSFNKTKHYLGLFRKESEAKAAYEKAKMDFTQGILPNKALERAFKEGPK